MCYNEYKYINKRSETDRRRKVFSGDVMRLPHIHKYVSKYCYVRRGIKSWGIVSGGIISGGIKSEGIVSVMIKSGGIVSGGIVSGGICQ